MTVHVPAPPAPGEITKATMAYFGDALPHFLAYFGASIVLAVIFLILYVAITPHKEFTLIKAGNNAAAVQLVGTLLGFAIPMGVVISHSVSMLDMLLWSVVAAVVQLVVFFILAKLFSGIEKRIEEDCVASGTFIGGMGLVFGVLQAFCMVP